MTAPKPAAQVQTTSTRVNTQGLSLSPACNNNSQLLLQPQTLHQQHLSSADLLKPRSYSASSEMLLSNANQYKFNRNTRALVGSPIHQYQRQQYHHQPAQRPRAASSSSMLQDILTHSGTAACSSSISRLYHPYQQLPGASLSLQTLNLNHQKPHANSSSPRAAAALNSSSSNGCVYLRPEQNIPEVFAHPGTVFKPIDEVDNASDMNDNDGSGGVGASSSSVLGHQSAISRDDIVVTMRSVNV